MQYYTEVKDCHCMSTCACYMHISTYSYLLYHRHTEEHHYHNSRYYYIYYCHYLLYYTDSSQVDTGNIPTFH